MKILITGGAGFIGSHLADKLIDGGHNVVVIDNLSTGKKENINSKAKFYEMDISSKELEAIFLQEKPEIVFHFAAQINVRDSVKDPIVDAQTNIMGSLNILENCRKFGIKKIIFPSSGGMVYGDVDVFPTGEDCREVPLSPYAIAKLSVEKYLYFYYKSFGLKFVVLRLANVYGPRQNPKGEAGVVAIFLNKMLMGQEPIINGDGLQTRDFIFVDDVVDASILAFEKDEIGIFNLGTSIETNVITIFLKLKELLGLDCKEIHGLEAPGESRRSCLDFSKIQRVFNWSPKYNFESGLKKTVEWFKDQ